MAIILGIDPGSRVTGYGVIDVAGREHRYVASGCIRTGEKAPMQEKLGEIFAGLEEIIGQHAPEEAAIEKIFMARSADSALKLGHARGVAMLAAVRRNVPLFEYEARKVKQAVVGSGAASKSQVQHMVQSLLGLSGKPQSDASDALAIAICHIHTRHNLARMAGANRFRKGRLMRTDS